MGQAQKLNDWDIGAWYSPIIGAGQKLGTQAAGGALKFAAKKIGIKTGGGAPAAAQQAAALKAAVPKRGLPKWAIPAGLGLAGVVALMMFRKKKTS